MLFKLKELPLEFQPINNFNNDKDFVVFLTGKMFN